MFKLFYIPRLVFLQFGMAAVILRRRANEGNSATSEVVDDRPLYLKEFPSEASMTKSLHLGVLLGRYGKFFHYRLTEIQMFC